MLLREVEYAKPGSVAEALELLASNDGARALAGGQTLINVMKARAASPDMLVDLNGLEELRGIELAGDGTLTIGAMTTYSELMASAEAKARPTSSGASTLSIKAARCSAPHDGKLHQASPQPCAPSASSTRTSTAGRSCIVPNEVRTGTFTGQRRTCASTRASAGGGAGLPRLSLLIALGIKGWSMVRLLF